MRTRARDDTLVRGRSPLLPKLFLALALTACGTTKPTATGSAPATGSPTGSTPTGSNGTGQATGTPTGTTTVTTPLNVTTLSMECGVFINGTVPPSVLTASATGPGEVQVFHEAFAIDCCPAVVTTATAVHATATLKVGYEIEPGDCLCVCALDNDYVLSGIPAGSWTVEAGGDTAPVLVP